MAPHNTNWRQLAITFLDTYCKILHDTLMNDEFSHRLKAARRASGMTQSDFAAAIGVSRAAVGQWENGINEPSVRNMKTINDVLNAQLHLPSGSDPAHRILKARVENQKPMLVDKKKEIFVEMAVIGRRAQCFLVGDEQQQAMDHIPRPDVLVGVDNSFCALVATDAMSPRFENNDIIYITPRRPLRTGDYCLVYIKDSRGVSQLFLRRFISMHGDSFVFEMLNPPTREEYGRAEVDGLDRVMPWNELLGSAPIGA